MNQPNPAAPPLRLSEQAILWLASGLGTGYARKAPGTVGSLLGPPLVWLLGCDVRHPWISLGMAVIAYALGTWLCNQAIRILNAKDPQLVVIDEITAFLWIYLLVPITWTTAIAGFVLFRIFDISKPWPVRRLEQLPRGWGVMSDDALAGMISGAILAIVWRLSGW